MSICKMESSFKNLKRMPFRTINLWKCLGISSLCSYLPIKRSCPNCWTINFIRWWSFCWTLSKSYWKSSNSCFCSSSKESCPTWRLFIKTKHDNLWIITSQKEIKQFSIRSTQNCQSSFKNSSSSPTRNHIFIRWANLIRSLNALKSYEYNYWY